LSSRRSRGLLSLALTLSVLSALAPSAMAAGVLSVTTPFPAVTVSPDSRVSFDLSIDTDDPARVALALGGVPASWTASLVGGGFVVSAVETTGGDPTEVRLDVDVPADATGTTRITVTGTGNGATDELALDIKVEAQAGGEVTVSPDFVGLKGSSDDAFKFNLTIRNGKAADQTFTVSGEGPAGWTVDPTVTGQTQAVTAVVKSGQTANVSVAVKAPAGAPAGKYPITVVVTVGEEQIQEDLEVEVTGSFALDLGTPNDLLSTHGPSGSVTEQSFEITNSGTSPLTAVEMTFTAPTNWKVEFDKPTIETIPAGATETVIAKITPSSNAIAGDYSIAFNARAKEANDRVEVRFTVETSIVGGILGGALIVAAVVGLWWVFRRYGRR
jgi:uncharacterized membrane protein